MTSLLQFDVLDVENDATTIALRSDEALEAMLDTQRGCEQRFGERADGLGTQFDRDLALGTELEDLRLVPQAYIERRQAGGGEPESASLDDCRRQGQPVRQAEASCGARRDSSRSTAFIITDGVVSA
jgi:hypothetical protein